MDSDAGVDVGEASLPLLRDDDLPAFFFADACATSRSSSLRSSSASSALTAWKIAPMSRMAFDVSATATMGRTHVGSVRQLGVGRRGKPERGRWLVRQDGADDLAQDAGDLPARALPADEENLERQLCS